MCASINNDKFNTIQVLRFIASAMVVVTHALFYSSERLGQETISWHQGTKGVDLFFVISGFVMYLSTVKASGGADGLRFFLNRLVRVIPLYWTATTLKVIASIVTASMVLHAKFDWSSVIKSYFFIPSINIDGEIKPFLAVGWTLIYEMFFYLLIAFFVVLRLNVIKSSGFLFLSFSILSVFFSVPNSIFWFFINPILMEFFWGMLVGWLILNKIFISRRVAIFLLIVSFVYLIISSNQINLHRVFESGIPAFLIVWSLASIDRQLNAYIHPAVVFLGAASYSLYLFHPLVSPIVPVILRKLQFGYIPIAVVGSVLIAFLMSILVHVFYEKPVTKLIRFYCDKLN